MTDPDPKICAVPQCIRPASYGIRCRECHERAHSNAGSLPLRATRKRPGDRYEWEGDELDSYLNNHRND